MLFDARSSAFVSAVLALLYAGEARAQLELLDPPPWSLYFTIGAAAGVETVADPPPAGLVVMTAGLERRFARTGIYLGVQLEAAFWPLGQGRGRAQAGAVLGVETPRFRKRWLLYAAVGVGYCAVGGEQTPSGYGPYARVELGVKYRPQCMANGPKCLGGDARIGPALQHTWLTYDTQDGPVRGRRLDPAVLMGMALNF